MNFAIILVLIVILAMFYLHSASEGLQDDFQYTSGASLRKLGTSFSGTNQ